MCAHLGPFDTGTLVCDRTTDHDATAATGHTYTHGSFADDRHLEGGHG